MRIIRKLSVVLAVISVAVFVVFYFFIFHDSDTNGPLIVFKETELEVSVDDNVEELLLEGVTAKDRIDGDVSDSLIVEGLSKFIDKGHCQGTIVAFDNQGNVSKSIRDVYYTDYYSPRFELEEPFRFPTGATEYLNDLSVNDCMDGDLTNSIKISGDYSVECDEPGEYPMEFYVTNSVGDTSKLHVTVEIYDSADSQKTPQIGLSDYLIYKQVGGKKVKSWNYLESITIGGKVFEKKDGYEGLICDDSDDWERIREDDLDITSNVDYDTPGSYEITYRYEYTPKTADDDQETESYVGTTRLIVVVTDDEE